uniref:Protein disulfide-isomerase n=1 Tax=Oryzias latipes TaxID=8090 RepID=A0A3B3IF56_ORYLA
MRKLLWVSLLALLLQASCIQANHSDDSTEEHRDAQDDTTKETPKETSAETDETEQPPKREKTTEIEEEQGIMVLHINNFDRALSETRHLMVEFYAPWCGYCRRFEPIYAEAAGMLKEEGSEMRLAKVDAIEEKELAEEFNVDSFPTVKLFMNGDRKEPIEYTGKRTPSGIVQWLKRRSGPGAADLNSADSAAEFINTHNVSVVGFFDNLESEAAAVFKEVAFDLTDVEFAVTASPEVFKEYEVTANKVVLFKKFDDGRADFELSEEDKLDKHNLTNFIKENSLELIVPFNQETSDKIFTSRVRLHCLLFINSTVESQMSLLEESKTVAREFKGKVLYILIDMTTAVSHVLNYFGVLEKDSPTVRMINMDTQKKFKIEVVDDTAEPYLRSEEIPEDWDKGPVKVLVAKNFETVAMDPTKNVFVEFYAPWCGHCKELAPIWEQLGEIYADHDDIIIAKMDATANEVESVAIDGFPTLKYFPAGDKEVISYTGNRDLETLSKFLDNGGVLPQEESDEDDDDEDEADKDKAQTDEREDADNQSKVCSAASLFSPSLELDSLFFLYLRGQTILQRNQQTTHPKMSFDNSSN